MYCCGKSVSKKKKIIRPQKAVFVRDYIEGQDGFKVLEYKQADLMRLKGCKSRHIYMFENFGKYKIDANDANCILDLHSSVFSEVKDAKGGNSKNNSRSKKDTSKLDKVDEPVCESGKQRVQGDGANLEQEKSTEV